MSQYPSLTSHEFDYVNLYCRELKQLYPAISSLPSHLAELQQTALLSKHLGMMEHYGLTQRIDSFKNTLLLATYYVALELDDEPLITSTQPQIGYNKAPEQNYYLDRILQLAIEKEKLSTVFHLSLINYHPYLSQDFFNIDYNPLKHALEIDNQKLISLLINQHAFIFLMKKNDLSTLQYLVQHQYIHLEDHLHTLNQFSEFNPHFLAWATDYLAARELSTHLNNKLTPIQKIDSQFKI